MSPVSNIRFAITARSLDGVLVESIQANYKNKRKGIIATLFSLSGIIVNCRWNGEWMNQCYFYVLLRSPHDIDNITSEGKKRLFFEARFLLLQPYRFIFFNSKILVVFVIRLKEHSLTGWDWSVSVSMTHRIIHQRTTKSYQFDDSLCIQVALTPSGKWKAYAMNPNFACG